MISSFTSFKVSQIVFVLLILTSCDNRVIAERKAAEQRWTMNTVTENDSTIKQMQNQVEPNRIDYDKFLNYRFKLSSIVDSMGVDTADIQLVIDKSDYTLSAVSGSTVLKQYPVVFGRNPIDPKLREGDCCTPEGTFRIITCNREAKMQ